MNVNKLFLACESGNDKEVKSLLKTGIDLNATDENGITACQVAAANDHESTLLLLLENGADINLANNYGWTCLHHAALHGHTDICRLLIRHRASPNKRNKFGATPLNVAASSGHVSTVKELLSVSNEPSTDQTNCPVPLSTATLSSHDAALREILDAKPMTNVTTSETQWTPLMFAAAMGDKPSSQILIERGADPNRLNRLQSTALDIAVNCGNDEISAYLAKKTVVHSGLNGQFDSKAEELLDAVKEKDVDRVADILGDDLVDVDVKDSTGATPLMLAAINGSEEVVRLLISLGANVNLQDPVNGWTALMQATFYGNKRVVKLLLDAGGDPTLPAKNGCTALDLATLVEETDRDILRLLADQTIHMAPPILSFKPVRETGMTRSVSSANLEGSSNGFFAWWNKISNRFKKVKFDRANKVSINIIPDEPSEDNGNVGEVLINNGSVFTLGFTGTTSDLSSYTVSPISQPVPQTQGLEDISFKVKTRMPEGHRTREAFVDTQMTTEKLLSDSQGTNRSSVSHLSGSVGKILQDGSLQKYHDLFEMHEIDVETLADLTESDLKDIGIDNEKDQRKLMKIINRLKRRQ